MDYVWEVYSPWMGFKLFEADCPIAAIEKAADEMDKNHELLILRGAIFTFGVRKVRSRKPFDFYQVSGRAIPIYELDYIDEQNLDEIFTLSFERDYLNYRKAARQ